jgi:hypothetical protein
MQALQKRHVVEPRIGIAALGAAAIFAAGMILGTLIDPDAVTIGSATDVPIGDRSYDAVEETRADRGLSVPMGDRSYDAVEQTRADRGLD